MSTLPYVFLVNIINTIKIPGNFQRPRPVSLLAPSIREMALWCNKSASELSSKTTRKWRESKCPWRERTRLILSVFFWCLKNNHHFRSRSVSCSAWFLYLRRKSKQYGWLPPLVPDGIIKKNTRGSKKQTGTFCFMTMTKASLAARNMSKPS